jgi:type IV fimbrial biogenesis protein FimT
MNARPPKMRGLTLIELMVTVALVAILLSLAVPSMTTFQRNAELTTFSNSMIASINTAKTEAMKRGSYAVITPADNVDWKSGLKAFVNTNRDGVYDASRDTIIFTRDPTPAYLTITPNGSASASPPYIMFDASGFSKLKNGAFGALTMSVARNDVGSGSINNETRLLIVSSTGRVRVCKPATNATCTTSATQ